METPDEWMDRAIQEQQRLGIHVVRIKRDARRHLNVHSPSAMNSTSPTRITGNSARSIAATATATHDRGRYWARRKTEVRETGLQYNPKIAQRTAGVEIRAFLQSKMQCYGRSIRWSNELRRPTRAA